MDLDIIIWSQLLALFPNVQFINLFQIKLLNFLFFVLNLNFTFFFHFSPACNKTNKTILKLNEVEIMNVERC